MTKTISSYFLILALLFAALATFGVRSPRWFNWLAGGILCFFLWRAFGGGNLLTFERYP